MDELKKEFQNSKNFKPYISSIVFVNYKNILQKSELTLDFPLTLLIGKNGTNKSSVLHAFYGCPDGKSTGEYWFATHIDPIEDRPAFFYRYTIPESNETAEVIKTIIKKKSVPKQGYDPDYWEPSRPIIDYGMAPLPKLSPSDPLPAGRSKTRWNAIKKNVIYLDFRSEISAFDKAFYKDNRAITRPSHRDSLRKRSKPLKKAITEGLEKCHYYKKQRIVTNYTFSSEEISVVNSILSTKYCKIVYIEHDFYLSGSFSVYLHKSMNRNYSEAFAGSGETSIVRLVYALEKAPEKSLILLDEPETSLHIDAQYQLQKYILDKIKSKKLQIIISTHSPFFAKNLPDCAIKILTIDSAAAEKVRIINSAPAHESSFHLGYRNHESNKINIYVEDKLAKAFVEYVSKNLLTDSERDQLAIHHFSGGANALIDMAAFEINRANSNLAFLFDGDCKPSRILDQTQIPQSEEVNLEQTIKDNYGHCPKIPCDSNQAQQRINNFRNFLDYSKSRFRYLPFNNPEGFLVSNHEELQRREDSSDPKNCFNNYVQEILGSSGEIHSNDILTIQRTLLTKIPRNHNDFTETAEILRYFISISPTANETI